MALHCCVFSELQVNLLMHLSISLTVRAHKVYRKQKAFTSFYFQHFNNMN